MTKFLLFQLSGLPVDEGLTLCPSQNAPEAGDDAVYDRMTLRTFHSAAQNICSLQQHEQVHLTWNRILMEQQITSPVHPAMVALNKTVP